jgi:hypothetical protein
MTMTLALTSSIAESESQIRGTMLDRKVRAQDELNASLRFDNKVHGTPRTSPSLVASTDMGEFEGPTVSTSAIHGLLVSVFAAIIAAPLARAELPSLQPLQTLDPKPSEVYPDPQSFPQTPFFAASLALEQNTLLSGMPGAFDLAGRVAVFTRNSAGTWTRTGTLKALDAASGAGFGNDVALVGGRALVASENGVYVFALNGGAWRQTQKLSFDGPVKIADLDWNGSIAVVGVGVDVVGTRSNGVYAFGLTSNGQLRRIAKFTAHDTAPRDLFGNRVAIAGTIVAITAPGYNSDQGAAYFFTCTLGGCQQRQKLLSIDGKPGDGFGSAVSLRTNVLVVGAPSAAPASRHDPEALGAGYVFVRQNGEWIEAQKLGPTATESDSYRGLGAAVAVAQRRVLISSRGLPGVVAGVVYVYEWSGGSLVATHIMHDQFWSAGYGDSVALIGNTAVVGFSEVGTPPVGTAEVYGLP